MKLSFLNEIYTQFEVELISTEESESAYIRNKNYRDIIRIIYDPQDFQPFTMAFSYQHRHFESIEELIEHINAYSTGNFAAIEFFDCDRNCFGGEMKTPLIDDMDYDKLRSYFGYPNRDISNLNFKVRAWEHRYCFDGYFMKDSKGSFIIIKHYLKQG